MTRVLCSLVLVALTSGAMSPALASAQNPPPNQGQQGPPDPQRGRGPRGGRQNLPPASPNMNMQEVQKWIDTWALIEAERALQLTQEQYPNFVARLTRLQNVRRRAQMERRRSLGELSGLAQGPGPHRDDVITEKLKVLDELNVRAAADIRQAYADLDAVITPAQRARFRLFEEVIERRKVDLLAKVRNPAGPPPAPPPGPPK
jgi:hypothetical protein